jgi:putative peptide zinc metalloprotease protein
LIAQANMPAPLPALREDVRLLKDSAAPTGAPRWLLHDPVRDTFFEIGLEAYQLISTWSLASTIPELSIRVSAETGRSVSEEEITEFVRFLGQMRLTQDAAGHWRELADAASKQKHGWFSQILHNYLFFKMPLVSPSAFLEKTLPNVRFLASKPMLALFTSLFLIGLYFSSRQWGDVTEGLRRQLNISGAMMFAVALFVMKIFHELGHAYVATAYGCRVRSMGIAVMMMAPMLYTDVTEAWRLPQRRKRMAIDSAGVAVEMVIAGLAILVWAFLPPGDGRDIALIVATAAVAMTLAVNLSPFMRFDGYYIFADLIGVKNLQSRAFALVRWRLREFLFALGRPAPDSIGGALRILVIAYGVCTMIYRLFLFTGIAVVVYYMTFKLLGLLLFAVEIVYFVMLPVWREVKIWWSLRSEIKTSPRAWGSAMGMALIVAGFALPWSTHVSIPAVLEPAQFARLFPATASEIKEIRITLGQHVKEGDVLLVLASPRLDKELAVTEVKLELVNQRMGRRVADIKDQAQTLSLEKDRLALIERVDTLKKQIGQLSIHAPLAGQVAELDPNLHVGRLVSRQEELGLIIAGKDSVIRGFADQQDIWRLKAGQAGRFIPDDAQARSITASLSEVTVSTSTTIDIPHLAETHGGKIRTQPPQADQPLVPLDPVHQIRLAPENSGREIDLGQEVHRPIRGIVIVDAAPQSMLATLWRRILKVLVQEAGA